RAVSLSKDRLTRLGEFLDLTSYLFGPPPDYDAALLVPKKATPEQTVTLVNKTRTLLESLPEPWTHEAWETGMRAIADEMSMKAGDVFMVLRVAVSGSTVSLPLFESIEIIGKDETLKRVDAAL